MITVEMTDDIRKYEIKSVGPFTTRQVIYIAISLIYCVPLAIFLPVSWDIKLFVVPIAATPCLLLGFLKMDGAKGEVFLLRYIYKVFLAPGHRKLKHSNCIKEAIDDSKKRAERIRISKMTPKQKKQYEKKQKKISKRKVTYSKDLQYKVYR